MTAAVHRIELYATLGSISPRLVCTATPDAPCRRRPADDREEWQDSDPDVTGGHDCWAVEWVEAAGFEDGVTWGSRDGVIASAAVHVSCDEGVVIDPAEEVTR